LNDTLKRIKALGMAKWDRKVQNLHGSFYINIPIFIMEKYGKRKGSVVVFEQVYDETTGKIMILLCL